MSNNIDKKKFQEWRHQCINYWKEQIAKPTLSDEQKRDFMVMLECITVIGVEIESGRFDV